LLRAPSALGPGLISICLRRKTTATTTPTTTAASWASKRAPHYPERIDRSGVFLVALVINVTRPRRIFAHLLSRAGETHYKEGEVSELQQQARKEKKKKKEKGWGGEEEPKKHTSSIDSIRSAKHTLLFRHLAQFPLGAKVLPLALAGLELLAGLDLAGQLGRPRRPIADLAGLLSRLAGQGRVDVGRRRDDVRIGGGGWKKGWHHRARRAVGLAFFAAFSRHGFDVFGREGLGCGVAFEGHDVDGFAGGAGDGGDSGWVEGAISRLPSCQDGVVDLEGDLGLGFLACWLGFVLAVAGLVGRVVLFRPLFCHRLWRGLWGRDWRYSWL
jgi:hypothetical protein